MRRLRISVRNITVLVILIGFAVGSLSAQDLPRPKGYVNDFADVIDTASERRIKEIAEAVEEQLQAEIAVVTIESYRPYGSIEQYSVELAESWGIGKEGEDTGLLFIVSIAERRARVEVGYGLEGIIPDGLAGEILDQAVLPYFGAGNYSTGFVKGVEAAAGILAKDAGVDLKVVSSSAGSRIAQNADDSSERRTSSGRTGIPVRFVMLIVFLIITGGRGFLWPLLFMGGGHRGFWRSGGGFGSFGRGGFDGGGGGGFSGFGGGGFGGGGASRGF